MDCIYCGLELSSQREIDGRETCQECDIKNRMSLAYEEVEELVYQGWGSQSAANSVQSKYNLSDSQTDDVAYRVELEREDR